MYRSLFTHAWGLNTSESPGIMIFVLYFSDKYSMFCQPFINTYKQKLAFFGWLLNSLIVSVNLIMVVGLKH